MPSLMNLGSYARIYLHHYQEHIGDCALDTVVRQSHLKYLQLRQEVRSIRLPKNFDQKDKNRVSIGINNTLESDPLGWSCYSLVLRIHKLIQDL